MKYSHGSRHAVRKHAIECAFFCDEFRHHFVTPCHLWSRSFSFGFSCRSRVALTHARFFSVHMLSCAGGDQRERAREKSKKQTENRAKQSGNNEGVSLSQRRDRDAAIMKAKQDAAVAAATSSSSQKK